MLRSLIHLVFLSPDMGADLWEEFSRIHAEMKNINDVENFFATLCVLLLNSSLLARSEVLSTFGSLQWPFFMKGWR